MRFNCGLSPDAKRVKRKADLEAYAKELMVWHPYFCLWPIRVAEGDCRWLEWIERKFSWADVSSRGTLFRNHARYRAVDKPTASAPLTAGVQLASVV